MAVFDLQIVTPFGMRFEGKAESITVNTTVGMITIMAGHTNYMAATVIGKAKVVTEDATLPAVCGNGFLSVENGKCNLLANSFDFALDLDKEKVENDLNLAKELLDNAKTDADKTIAKGKLKLAELRMGLLEE
jgi:F-type H+-transporting ATPase subunit epsilon